MSIKATPATLMDAVWTPERGSRSLLRWTVLVFLGSIYIAACAQIQVPMWPVPMTMQTFGVLTLGIAYGWRAGGLSLALYLLEGAAGLPVFAGFSAGPAVLAGPTGGYIFGFVLAAALVGWLAELGWDRRVVTCVAAMLLGSVVLFLPGVAWLANFYASAGEGSISGTGAETALGAAIVTGVTPFLLGEALKIALATALVRAGWSVIGRLRT